MKTTQQGFTLIELMIVVVVIAILSAIAYPSYQEYVRRGYRAEARTGLMQAAQWLERVATATGRYPDALPSALTKVESNSYTIAYTPQRASSSTSSPITGFTLKATPQRQDKCHTYTFDNNGRKGLAPANKVNAALVQTCWGK